MSKVMSAIGLAPKVQKMQEVVKETVRMPTVDKTEEIAMQRKKLAERGVSQGRESTNLTGDYSGTILGN